MLVVVPSRGRPQNLKRLLDACAATRSNAKIWVRLDKDDPTLFEYLKLDLPTVHVGEQVKAAGAMEEAFRFYPDEQAYGLIGDDAIPKTFHWDRKLYVNPWTITYPDDGIWGESYASHPFVGGDFVRAIGFYALPGLVHLYTDTVWDHLGRLYGNIIYKPQVRIEHLHWSVGKAPKDATYERVFNGKPHAKEDELCFLNWKAAYKIDSGLKQKIAGFVPQKQSC